MNANKIRLLQKKKQILMKKVNERRDLQKELLKERKLNMEIRKLKSEIRSDILKNVKTFAKKTKKAGKRVIKSKTGKRFIRRLKIIGRNLEKF